MTTLSDGVLVEKPRISSIDVVRGLVMVIMALDHIRDYFHIDAFNFDPTDMTRTNPALFFTRWITHFCAPTFVLLSGASARLGLERRSKKELSKFLATRGLWLIVLEITVVRFALLFNFYYDITLLQVIWAIGGSMLITSILLFLPERIILILGLILIFGHNAFDGTQFPPGTAGFLPAALFLKGGAFQIGPGLVAIPYTLFPWLGIFLSGYVLGSWYTPTFDPVERRKLLLRIGVALVLLFLILRFINIYGDPTPWTSQKNILFTIMSFLNCTKYPVSLLFASMTVGPVLILLSFMERVNITSLKPLLVLGRVPLFYFIAHFLLLHVLALVLRIIMGTVSLSSLDFHFSKGFGGIPPNTGVSLVWVYVAWYTIVLSLYPLCRWYDRYKRTHDHGWLGYL